MELFVYLSESDEEFNDFNNSESLVWHQSQLTFDMNPSNLRAQNLTLQPTSHLLSNGTWFAHVYFVKKGHSPDPTANNYNFKAVSCKSVMLNAYRPKPKVHNRKNLISGEYADNRINTTMNEDEIAAKTMAPEEIVSFWKPQLTIRLVHDFTVFPPRGIPPPLDQEYRFVPKTSEYFPTIYFDYFWVLRDHYVPILSNTTELQLEISYRCRCCCWCWRWCLCCWCCRWCLCC